MIKIIAFSLSFDNDNEDFLTEYCNFGYSTDDILNPHSSYDEFGLYIIRTVV
jgi:hypothetical protein